MKISKEMLIDWIKEQKTERNIEPVNEEPNKFTDAVGDAIKERLEVVEGNAH